MNIYDNFSFFCIYIFKEIKNTRKMLDHTNRKNMKVDEELRKKRIIWGGKRWEWDMIKIHYM